MSIGMPGSGRQPSEDVPCCSIAQGAQMSTSIPFPAGHPLAEMPGASNLQERPSLLTPAMSGIPAGGSHAMCQPSAGASNHH